MLRISAPAKINLSLEVTGRRSDGFHGLVSLMQEVTLADEIEVHEGEGLQLTVDADSGPVEENLSLLAARLLAREVGVAPRAAIVLKKRIPVGGGLGGGSSDAASTLIALNHFWKAGLDCTSLSALAAELGSDVPFFLTGGLALVSGRGEEVRPLAGTPETWYVLVNPGFHVSTARVFSALSAERWSSGTKTRKLAAEIDAGALAGPGVNELQPALFNLYPAAETCFRVVERLAPGRTRVSGSGPTVFAAVNGREEAERISANLRRLGYWVRVVRNCATEGRDLPCRALSL